eukprot:5122469-Ditylum_brightwellii.AAC.1
MYTPGRYSSSRNNSLNADGWNVNVMGSKEHKKNRSTPPDPSSDPDKPQPSIRRTQVKTFSPWGKAKLSSSPRARQCSAVDDDTTIVTPHQRCVIWQPKQETPTTYTPTVHH